METAGPDAAYLAEGTGAPGAAETATRVESLAIAARFEGFGSPETGDFDVWLVSPEEWEAGVLEADGTFRRTQHALNDYCIALESLGVANSVRIATDRNSIAVDDDCPVGLDGTPVLLNYTGANGAYCAQVNILSNYTFPLEHLYAEIRNITDGFEMYTNAVKVQVGLGNGALAPITDGNNTPTDTYGLVGYPDLPNRGDNATEWWIFQRPGDSDFFFSGVVVFSPTEVDNDVDDDCDDFIDEDTQSFEDGDDCSTGNDCIGGTCDCAGFPCTEGETPVCRTPFCGDGFVEGAEDCDPGTGLDTAACNFDCTWSVCGDNYVNAVSGEECDPGEVGGFTAECDDDCTFAICHDGTLNTEAGEICDDGNIDNTDDCVDECVPAFCGDGHTRVGVSPGGPGYEECDDANTNPNDACVDCLAAYCGDGWVQAGVEECDGDGAGTGGETDLCNANCTFAICGDGIYNPTSGEVCDEGVNDVQTNTQTCDGDCSTPVCGDEYVNDAFTPASGAPGRVGPRGTEMCDAGSLNNDEGACTSDCQFAFCGDGLHRQDITDDGDPEYEACDNGDPAFGGLNSDTEPDACRTNCVEAFCGDNVIDPAGQEQCDNGDQNSDTEPGACRTDCGFFSCGDGVRDPAFVSEDPGIPDRPAEMCDFGDTVNGNVPDGCRSNCTTPTCGDGVHDPNGGTIPGDPEFGLPEHTWDPEPCDDGDSSNNNDCLVGCVIPTCGDGFVWNQGSGTENCDDGNTLNGDGCSSNCIRSPGWTCPNPGQPCQPICGDGLLRGDEVCDDGDTDNGDGCSSTCEIEDGWYCTRPNTETADTCVTQCGDGIRAGAEFCDTINDQANCDAGDCTAVACGDGYQNVVAGEACDDGNTVSTDGCLGDCSAVASCGDSWVQAGVEQCDTGGNSQSCDGPSAGAQSCTFASCGDGYTNSSHVTTGAVGSVAPGPELCDAGGSNSNTAANACRTNCQPAQCGDGVRDTAGLDGNEECDTGTSRSNTAANACRMDCDNPSCGDGVIDANSWDLPGYSGAPNPPRCDGSTGLSGVQTCQGCIKDMDGDGYVAIAYGGTDCDDTNGSIHPGAPESTDFLDTVDSNCDGFNFDIADGDIFVVHSTCGGMPSSLSGRCRTSIQAAVNLASAGDVVLVRAPGATTSSVVLKNGVSIYGGWNHSISYGWGFAAGWGPWDNLPSSRSPLTYNGTSTAPYHAAVIGAGLTSHTEIRSMIIDANAPTSTSTDATTMHGITVSHSNGFDLVNSTVTVDGGLNGTAVNRGNPDYPGGGNDCQRPGMSNTLNNHTCGRGSNGGQGNGWWLWSPSAGNAHILRMNSAQSGGTGGGSSIGVLLSNSPSALISGNSVTVGPGGAGVNFNGVGSGGGHSVPMWFFQSSPTSSYAGFSLNGVEGTTSDCSTNTNGATVSGNVLTRAAAGSGGSGTWWAAGRPGMTVLCHRQANVFEWYSQCSQTANALTWSFAHVGIDHPSGTVNPPTDGMNRRLSRLGNCN